MSARSAGIEFGVTGGGVGTQRMRAIFGQQVSGMALLDKSKPARRAWGVASLSGATVVLSLLPVDMVYGVAVMASLGPMASPLAIWSAFLPVALGNFFWSVQPPAAPCLAACRWHLPHWYWRWLRPDSFSG